MTLKELLGHHKVKRICVGRCVDGSPWEDDYTDAHAHLVGFYRGWICVRSARDILCVNNDNLSRTMMHEFCHVLSNQQYHTDRWRKEMHRQGQPIPKRYQKRRRH